MPERTEQATGNLKIGAIEGLLLAKRLLIKQPLLASVGVDLTPDLIRNIVAKNLGTQRTFTMTPEQEVEYEARLRRKLEAIATVEGYEHFIEQNPIPGYTAVRTTIRTIRPALIGVHFMDHFFDTLTTRPAHQNSDPAA